MTRAVYIIASGARPAADIAELVTACSAAGWDPCVGATPSGLADTWAACTLIKCWGLGAPLVVAPNVNPALTRLSR